MWQQALRRPGIKDFVQCIIGMIGHLPEYKYVLFEFEKDWNKLM